MPLPLANLALSLAPLAADLVGKIVGMKKDANSKKDVELRLEKLENYEVEQARLIQELTLKVEFLQKSQKKLVLCVNVLLIALGVCIATGIVYYIVQQL